MNKKLDTARALCNHNQNKRLSKKSLEYNKTSQYYALGKKIRRRKRKQMYNVRYRYNKKSQYYALSKIRSRKQLYNVRYW